MGILRKLFSRSEPEPPPEHAVIVRFRAWGDDLNAIFDLETELEAAIASAGVGEFDGNEVATDGSEGSLYMYGPDADRLFSVCFVRSWSAPSLMPWSRGNTSLWVSRR